MPSAMWKSLVIFLILCSLSACATFNSEYNHHYEDMPRPLVLYFTPDADQLSFETQVALHDRAKFLHAYPEVKAQVIVNTVSRKGRAKLNHFAHMVGDALVTYGAEPEQVSVLAKRHGTSNDADSHIAVRLDPPRHNYLQ